MSSHLGGADAGPPVGGAVDTRATHFEGPGGEETETKGVRSGRSGGTVKDARKVMSRWSLRPRPHPTCLHAASPVHAQIPDPTFHLRTQSV